MSVPDLSRQLGRYKLQRMLGEGNMGKVYRAIDSRLEREIALKIPTFAPNDEAGIKRFHREAHAAAVVNHPNICPVYDVEEINGVHFITMPLIEGEPLSNLVGPGKTWDVRKAAEMIKTLALAMDEMHKKGLMHRDLKPANVMIRTRDKVPVIMDMGLARSYISDLEMVTVQGQKIGTPAYMSPEQVRGDVHMTHSCDIYSLGIIFFQLLTGKVPFVGKPGHIYTHIVNTPADPPSSLRPDVPKQLDAISLRTLQKNPEDRFATMAEFAAYLDQYLQSTGGGAGADDGRLQQTLRELQRLQAQMQALAQAATEERQRRFALEQQVRDMEPQLRRQEQQAVDARSEVEMTRKMWAAAERKYVEQINELKAAPRPAAAPSEEQRRLLERTQEQLKSKESEIEMLKNFWQATERQYQYKMEDLTRQARESKEEVVMVRQRQGNDAVLKQKYDALERELQSLKTKQQGEADRWKLDADQVRAELEQERQGKQAMEDRLEQVRGEAEMIKRLFEQREKELLDKVSRAQEDFDRLNKQQAGVDPKRFAEAEKQTREFQELLAQEKQQRQALEEQLKQTAEKLQGSLGETEMIRRMWSATEKNFQEQNARLQEDLSRAQGELARALKVAPAEKERFEKLNQELKDAKELLAHKEESLTLLQAEQGAVLENLAQKTSDMQAAKEAAAAEQKQREALEQRLAELQTALQQAQTAAEAADQAKAKEEEQSERLEQRHQELEEQLAQSQADHQSWQQRLEAARSTEDQLRQKLQSATETAGQVAAMQQRLRALQEELEQEQKFRQEAEEEILRLANASAVAPPPVDEAKVVELEARLAEKEKLAEERQQEFDKLRQDVEEFRRQAAAGQTEAAHVAEKEADLAQERQLRADLETLVERLRNDLRTEQESVDGLIQNERSRYRDLEDASQQERQRLEQELETARAAATPGSSSAAAPGDEGELSTEQQAKMLELETQVAAMREQLAQTDAMAAQVRALEELLARQREQQIAVERQVQEATQRADALQTELNTLQAAGTTVRASESSGAAEERLRQLQQQIEQEREQRQESEDRAREAIGAASDMRRRLKEAEEELERERRRERSGPDPRVLELEKQIMPMREKLMNAEYAQKDAEMKLGFLQRRMDTVDQLAAEDTRRRVEAERRQREAEALLEEERKLRQSTDRRALEMGEKMQQAQFQLEQTSRSITNEKQSRVLAEQELQRLRTQLESLAQPSTGGKRSGAHKRPGDSAKSSRAQVPPPLPLINNDDGPNEATQEVPGLAQSGRGTPATGVAKVINDPVRPTPEGTGYPRVQVELRGSWYCRPKDDPAAKWMKVAETPALVQVKPGEIYFLKIANVVTDAELVLLNSLRQVPSLHTLSLSGCPEVTDQGLIHLRTLGQLQALNLASTPGITDAGLAHLRGLSRLTILSLNSCAGISDPGLAHVGILTSLLTLYLDNCSQITDFGINRLRTLTNLQALILTGCSQITDAALETVGTLRNLQTLNLDRCPRITDRGLSHLRELVNLNSLSLDRCELLTDAGLLHLRDLENLQSLSLTYCPRITQAGLNHLQHLTKLQTISFLSGPGQRPARV
jgi:hypothetical protein